ncbi:MAG: dephospho-CoA kinase [Acidobacteriota bacterium]|jgi:dephospho-CoA kinase
MLRVGLTGGIACGKTRVLRRLAAGGLATLDLDAVAHEVMAPGGAAYDDVVAAFGADILAADGTIDREALGNVVFGDPTARSRLDTLVHPRVREEEGRRAERFEAEGREVLVSDAALLVEAGVHLRFDRLVVVHCPAGVQQERLMARDAIPAAAARARIDAQMPIAQKRRFAHLEVDTSGSLSETDAAADDLARDLRAYAADPHPPRSAPRARVLGGLVHGAGGGPRGLDPATFVEVTAERGGVEMPALAQRLRPPTAGPWYRAARPEEEEPWPETLAVPLVLWALGRGRDEDWVLGASASLARLTHPASDAVAAAAVAALAALAVASSGRLEPAAGQHDEWVERSRRWGGTAPAPRVRRSLEAASLHPDDPGAAREAAEAARGEPALAGGLVGMALGVAPADADPALVSLAERLG